MSLTVLLISSFLEAWRLEKEDWISHWQRLYGERQRQPQSVPLCCITKRKYILKIIIIIKNHPNISSGHRIPMLFKTFFLADFRLMCIIQPAACTAVDKKQNDINWSSLSRLLISFKCHIFVSFRYLFVLFGSWKFIFTVLLNNVIEVGWKGKITCARHMFVKDASLFFFHFSVLAASIRTLYAAFFSYSDKLG